MATFEHPIKCMTCGLHFVVVSWHEEWGAERVCFCPECGAVNGKLVWRPRKVDKQIFEIVPGDREILSLGT